MSSYLFGLDQSSLCDFADMKIHKQMKSDLIKFHNKIMNQKIIKKKWLLLIFFLKIKKKNGIKIKLNEVSNQSYLIRLGVLKSKILEITNTSSGTNNINKMIINEGVIISL